MTLAPEEIRWKGLGVSEGIPADSAASRADHRVNGIAQFAGRAGSAGCEQLSGKAV